MDLATRHIKKLKTADVGTKSSSAAPTSVSSSAPQNVEVNNIFIDDSSLSVGNIIKTAAFKIHDRYFDEATELTDRDRKIMT
ncbi:hypothetical protein DFQ30_000743 [Apophysomyces sp. BC1015]|nr:hypothetical protein DFQ30_000743 [Apophysomyces sp. BC1015]